MKTILTIPIIFCFLIVKLNAQDAQTDWIKPLSVNELTLSADKKSVLDKIKAMDYYENPVMIETKSIAKSISSDGSLSFVLPGSKQTFTARANEVEAISEDTYTWMGKFDEDMGSIIVVSDEGKIRAHINVLDEIYEIFSVDKDLHVLMKVKDHNNPNQKCGHDVYGNDVQSNEKDVSGTDGIDDLKNSNSRIVPCPETIRVLALTTPRARNTDPNLNQTINLAISQFNQVRSNSQVSAQASLTLAGITAIDFVENRFNIENDLDALIADPDIQGLRNDADADIVVIFTDVDYIVDNFNIYGIAGPRTLMLDPDSAYAIVEIPQATTIYTATHEIGHLFGARHNRCYTFPDGYYPCDPTQPYTFNHGHRWSYGTWIWTTRRHSIMHTIQADHTVQPYFSNPNLSDHGKPMGTTTFENNARWISEHANQVSQFRLGGVAMTAYFEGPYELYQYNPYGVWEAVVRCGDAPYTYQWRTSQDGFNFGGVSGTGETFGHYSFQSFYLRLTVTSNDGQQSTYTQYIYFNSGGYRLATEAQDDINLISDESNEILLSLGDAYPNPSSDKINLPFTVNIKQPVKIELLDINGKTVLTLADHEFERGFHELYINISRLNSGLYMYKMTCTDFSSSKKILINK